jgi:hypothetical protein
MRDTHLQPHPWEYSPSEEQQVHPLRLHRIRSGNVGIGSGIIGLWGKVPTSAKYNQMFGLDLTGAVGSFQIHCPFCKSKGQEFQLDTRDETEDGDQ